MLSRRLTVLGIAREIQKEVRRTVVGLQQVYRHELKLKMLRLPAWRYRVIKDLGGIEKLLRLKRRLFERSVAPQAILKRQTKTLSYEEIKRREHIQSCAKACAHPRILRDPFRVDQEGQFRLPPMPRQALTKKSKRIYEYDYDARPVTDFKGINAPITVWPEEFMVFMNWEKRPQEEKVRDKPRRFAFVDKWLAAILKETAEPVPTQPILKTKTARAPPCVMLSLNNTPPVSLGRWV